MEKLKNQVLNLYNDKARFLKVVIHTSIGLLFFIGLFFAFLKSPTIINGKVSLSEFPGSFIFETLILLPVFAYAILSILENEKWLKKILLVQLVFATLFHLYGALMLRVGSEGTATGAFGRIWTFVFLVLMYLQYVKPQILEGFIGGFFNIETEATTDEPSSKGPKSRKESDKEEVLEATPLVKQSQTQQPEQKVEAKPNKTKRTDAEMNHILNQSLVNQKVPEGVDEHFYQLIGKIVLQGDTYAAELKAAMGFVGKREVKKFLAEAYPWIDKTNLELLSERAVDRTK